MKFNVKKTLARITSVILTITLVFFITTPKAHATIAQVAQTSGSGLNGGTTGSIDTTGATLLVVVISSGLATAGTVTDNKGNTWTQVTSPSTNVVDEDMYYAWNPTVGTGHTVTVTATGGAASFEFAAFSGVQTSADPLDQTTYKPTSGTFSANPGSLQTAAGVTPTSDGQLIVMGIGSNNTNTGGSPGSFDSSLTTYSYVQFQGGDHYASRLGYYVQPTAGLINPTWSETSDGDADFVSGTLASFKAAPAAASTAVVPTVQLQGTLNVMGTVKI